MRPILQLVCFAISVGATAAAAVDPRLGPPFETRPRPTLGVDTAPIVVIEFGSYKCGHCEEFHQRVFPQLQEQYVKTGKVQWFMIPASDDSSNQSSRIFAVGRCVHRQGKFWDSLEFLMKISNKPSSFLDDLIAQNAAIDSSELTFCLQDREIPRLVTQDFNEYRLLKIQGTPTFIVRKLKPDGTRTEAIVRGYQPTEYFQRLFDDLAKAP
jgi:protein-disulfide isomerase